MADYDFSKPAPDRSHRVPNGAGTGTGGIGFILAGIVIVLVVLYAVFGGAGLEGDPAASGAPTPITDTAPAIDAVPVPVE